MKRREILLALGIVLCLAVFIAPFSSSSPDGLEWVAEKLSFEKKGGVAPVLHSPLPDYRIPGSENELPDNIAVGFIGVLTMFGIGCAIAALLARQRK